MFKMGFCFSKKKFNISECFKIIKKGLIMKKVKRVTIIFKLNIFEFSRQKSILDSTLDFLFNYFGAKIQN